MDMKPIEPYLSDRPYDTRVERAMRVSPQAIYRSFTTGWEDWFALEGTLIADPVLNGQLFFVVEHEANAIPTMDAFSRWSPTAKSN